MAHVVEHFGAEKVKFSQQLVEGEPKAYTGPLSSFNTALPGERLLGNTDDALAPTTHRQPFSVRTGSIVTTFDWCS